MLRKNINNFVEKIEKNDLNSARAHLLSMIAGNYPKSIISASELILLNKAKKYPSNIDEEVLISVIIPIYDREKLLIESINSILNQTYQNFELILVSDGSPPGTLRVLDFFKNNPKIKIFYFPRPSGNAVRARNKGILESSGKYVAFLDSDDVAQPNRLELSLRYLEEYSLDVVYGDWQVILDGTRYIDGFEDGKVVNSAEYDLNLLKNLNIICQSTVTIRKSIILKSGYIKNKMQYREDHEFWLRLAYNEANFKRIPEVLVKLRLHSGNNELNFKSDDLIWENLVKQEFCIKGIIPKKIIFILPSVGISGGIGVVFKHADMLINAGHDVTILNVGPVGDGNWFPNRISPIIHITDLLSSHLVNIDMLFATEWSTVAYLEKFSAKRKLYFVQSDERRFYDEPEKKSAVHATYQMDLEFVTEAHWIRHMLRYEFSKNSYYVPNGLDPEYFYEGDPIKSRVKDRVRVLLEGPICIPFKGMADSYAAIKDLDCEIWIVSSAGKPPPEWRYDKFFEAVPFVEMRKIYSSCDIFLKMSRVEGFFGPPLEAMACGCAVVVGKVTGYDEFIVHEHNALVVEQGDIHSASNSIKKLIDEPNLRQRLVNNGYITAKNWTWHQSARCMLEVCDKYI